MDVKSRLQFFELIGQNAVPEEVIKTLPRKTVDCVSEIAYNILYGDCPLTDAETTSLRENKVELIRLSDKRATLKERRALITAKLLQVILPPVKRFLEKNHV